MTNISYANGRLFFKVNIFNLARQRQCINEIKNLIGQTYLYDICLFASGCVSVKYAHAHIEHIGIFNLKQMEIYFYNIVCKNIK